MYSGKYATTVGGHANPIFPPPSFPVLVARDRNLSACGSQLKFVLDFIDFLGQYRYKGYTVYTV